jgi:hypothetical protein
LASRKRAQIVGRFLLRAAGPDVEVIRKRDRVSPKPAGSADADLVSALANFGASKKVARSAAELAAAQLPAGSFDDRFRVAVQSLKRSA